MSTRRSLARFSGFLLTRHVVLQLCCMRILTNEIYSAHGWAIPFGQYIANKEHGHGRAATRAPSPRPHPLPPLLYTKLSRTASSYSRGERGAERRGGPLWSPVSSEWL